MATVNWSLQHFTDTAANFTANNPTLLAGQLGIETDGLTTTPKFKIGDGVTAWNTLPYFYGGSASAQNLNNVLSVGNTTSGNNIVMSGTDVISDSTGTNMFVDLNASTIYSTDGYNRMAFTADISGKTSEISVRDYSVITLEKGYVRAGITDIYSGVISQSTGWYNQIHTNLSHIEVQSNWANFRGIEYLNDWSANYSLRSLVDKGYVINNFVPYTGATSDVDLGAYLLSTKSIRVTGTSGSGDIHLKHQSADATATGQSTSLFADSNGDLKWKNDGNYYTTLKTSTNTANRIYTYPDADGTIALTSNIGTWGALNYPTWVSGTPFVKMTAAGTFALDTNTYQPLDSDLTSWAGVTRASGFDTFVATPSSANLAALVTGETGSGALVFGTSPTFTTDITTPLIIGGSAVGSTIKYKGTSGNGTSTVAAHQFLVGNNGATTAASIYNSGQINIGNYASPTNLRILTIGQDTAYMSFGSVVGSTSSAGIYLNVATPSLTNYSIGSDGTNLTLNSQSGAGSITLRAGNSNRYIFNTSDSQFTPTSISSGSTTTFSFTVPANTGQTASTEISNFKVNGASKTWNSGNITTQRWNYFTANTAAFASASTISESIALAVEAATAGTNATITNNFALGLTAGTATVKIGNVTGSTTDPAIYMNQASPTNSNYTLQVSGGFTILNGVTNALIRANNGTKINCSTTSTAFTQGAASSGAVTTYDFTLPSNTGQTASTEIPNFKVTGNTKTWAAGAITTQRWNYFTANTAAFASASTITNSYGLYVEAATAGTNATITNNWALGTNGGIFLNGTANTVLGNAALATNATTGFLHVPSCAGTPTGTPTLYTGMIPVCADSTNNKLYIYSGGTWVALN